MKFITTTFVTLLLITTVGFAQFTTSEDIDELCGFRMTPQFEQRLDRNLKVMRSGNYQRSNTIKYAPITLHLVGRTDGSDAYPTNAAIQRLCELNRQFYQAGIQFYLVDQPGNNGINYPNNDSWYAGSGLATMLAFHKKPNCLNLFITGTALSGGKVVCGFYTGQNDIIVVQKSCYGINNTTMMHELGHMLTLPHTFSGLEGFPQYNCGNQAPANYEKLDGSNCTTIGDRFCDTGPDYLSDRWNCTTQGVSTCQHVDANGDTFFPSGRFAMSYSNDGCVNLFSGEQITSMNIDYDSRSDIQPNGALINDTITAAVQQSEPPENSTTVGYSEQFFSWFPVPLATKYLFELSRTQIFNGASLVKSVVTTDPWLTNTDGLDQLTDYYWRVKPINQGYFCASHSVARKFTTSDNMIAVNDIPGVSEVQVFPNPSQGVNQITLTLASKSNMPATVSIYAVDGKQLKSQSLDIRSSENSYAIDVQNLNAGLYLLSLETKEGTIQQKLIISK